MGAYERIVAAIKAAADITQGLQQIILGTPGAQVFYPEALEDGPQNTYDTGKLWSGEIFPLVIEKIADEIDQAMFEWRYFETTLPTGIDASDLIACYQFDGTANALLDRGPNGYNLQMSPGSAGYSAVPVSTGDGYLVGMAHANNRGMAVANAAHNAAFRATGDMTSEFIFVYDGNIESRAHVLLHICALKDTTPESEVNNVAQYIQLNTANGCINFGHEYGAGANWVASVGYCYPGIVQHLIVTRSATGQHDLYQNGKLIHSLAAGHPYTGGGNSILAIGREATVAAGQLFNGVIISARFASAFYTAAQALESYHTVRGIA
jgi:hypothetical protein